MKIRPTLPAIVCLAAALVILSNIDPDARQTTARDAAKDLGGPAKVLVLDGSPVHDVGNLRVHVPNWGMIGSMPTSAQLFSSAPSAEWPAGSGVEYLYAAGLWVGAAKGGLPAVSTATLQMEFRPTIDPLDVVYYAAEGDPGGKRVPDPGADDDGDGAIDEEWLDGWDNDGDGLVDEDFAAISDQMLSCWYTDDQPEAISAYPQHNPMNLLVRQRSYQWEDTGFDEFVGFDYTITNTGPDTLLDVFVGWFVDGDAGPRNQANYWTDDGSGFIREPFECTPWGAFGIDYAFVYDVDGDGGQTPGYFGILMLDHPTDPSGQTAPDRVGFCTYQLYRGTLPYDQGGDPTNDFERYDAMSSCSIDNLALPPSDVRFLVASGPFASLPPGGSLEIRMALVVGDASAGLDPVFHNLASARATCNGVWYNLDGDPTTGVAGRETPVGGPASNVAVDSCASPSAVIPFVPPGATVWVNADCAHEESSETTCGYSQSDSLVYKTGVGGRESRVPWTPPTQSITPVLIQHIAVTATPAAAVLSWAVFADEYFAGYRVYRSSDGGRTIALPASGLIPSQATSFADSDVFPGRRYRYSLAAVMPDGSEVRSREVEAVIPTWATELHQNRPNPFNPATVISFTLASAADVVLTIHTPDGKLVATLVDGVRPAGLNEVSWDGKDAGGGTVSSGVYFYRLRAGKTVISKKMVVLK